jgi:histone H3/H4
MCYRGSEKKTLNTAPNRKRGYRDGYMTNLELSIAPMHRIIKKARADRVSESAAKALAVALEKIGVQIAEEAIGYAMHAGRKTVKAEDIEIATRKVVRK